MSRCEGRSTAAWKAAARANETGTAIRTAASGIQNGRRRVRRPKINGRYIYVAAVLIVLAVFVNRRFLVVAIGVQLASVFTCLAYLVNGESPILPRGLLFAVAVAVAVGAGVVAIVVLIRRLRAPV